MPTSIFEAESGRPYMPAGDRKDGTDANLSAVLVVGRSRVTRVVVTKIVERSGLRPSSGSPDGADELLRALRPGTVILDGGTDNCDCNHLLADIATQRSLSERNLPRVILLSTRIGTPESLSLGPTIDAVVAKPITPEGLQPIVDRLVETARM